MVIDKRIQKCKLIIKIEREGLNTEFDDDIYNLVQEILPIFTKNKDNKINITIK